MIAIVAALALLQQDELTGILKKFSESKSYSWKGITKFEGGMPGGGEIPDARFEGAHEDGVATHLLTDNAEFFRVGEKTVTRPRGEWRLIDPNDPSGRGRGRMFGMGGAPKIPHEELKNLGLTDILKAAEKEKIADAEYTVFTAKLGEEAARAAAPMGRMLERLQDAEVTGTFKAWINAEGRLFRYQISVKVVATMQDNEFQLKSTRITTVQDGAKVDVPADAKRAFEGQRKDY
jgi:hypothetical protein